MPDHQRAHGAVALRFAAEAHLAHPLARLVAPTRRRRAAARGLDEAPGHDLPPVLQRGDGADVGIGVHPHPHLEVQGRGGGAEGELSGNGRGVMVDDQRQLRDARAAGDLGDADRDQRGVFRPHRRLEVEDGRVDRRLDVAAGHAGPHVLPGGRGLQRVFRRQRGRSCKCQRKGGKPDRGGKGKGHGESPFGRWDRRGCGTMVTRRGRVRRPRRRS